METDYEELSDPIELKRAIEQWGRGGTIPLTLAMELMGLGYDVEALELKYRT